MRSKCWKILHCRGRFWHVFRKKWINVQNRCFCDFFEKWDLRSMRSKCWKILHWGGRFWHVFRKKWINVQNRCLSKNSGGESWDRWDLKNVSYVEKIWKTCPMSENRKNVSYVEKIWKTCPMSRKIGKTCPMSRKSEKRVLCQKKSDKKTCPMSTFLKILFSVQNEWKR